MSLKDVSICTAPMRWWAYATLDWREARKREPSELSVSLASEDEHRGVRSAIAASGELDAKHVVRSKPPL